MIPSHALLPIPALLLAIAGAAQKAVNAPAAVDAYIDARFEAGADATEKLLAALARADIIDIGQIEASLRAPRYEYPDVTELIGKTTIDEVTCYHVDYTSNCRLYVPKGYRADRPTPLVVVGHGGNSSMSPGRAASVAESYLRAYAPVLSREMNALVVAPESTRGWGHIGNSLILSTISALQRQFCIDPDRIYVTGQSMGGHMAYRAALTLGDRWAAVSPHSGGYDFVEKGSIGNLLNVPGYVTWGIREPYGIDKDSRTNAAWGKARGLDWVFVEKNGGHEIYADELPNVARFFLAHPRNPYPERVYLRQGGEMKFTKTWGVKGWPEHKVDSDKRPLRWNLCHWLEVTPRPEVEGPLTVLAKNVGDNRFEVTSDQVRELTIRLHPKMVDLREPVRITVNGEQVFDALVEPDPAQMLELVREFDDRGRIYQARVTVKVATDREVTVPPAHR